MKRRDQALVLFQTFKHESSSRADKYTKERDGVEEKTEEKKSMTQNEHDTFVTTLGKERASRLNNLLC